MVLMIGVRKLLHLETSPYLEQLNARELASMLYRDNLRLKHAARKRLQDELDSAKLADEMRQVQADRESGLLELTPAANDPLARALLSHLQEAPGLARMSANKRYESIVVLWHSLDSLVSQVGQRDQVMFSMPATVFGDKCQPVQQLVSPHRSLAEQNIGDMELEDADSVLDSTAVGSSSDVLALPGHDIVPAAHLFQDDAARHFAKGLELAPAFRDHSFFRISSGAMDRHVITGTPLRQFDFMVQCYLPVEIDQRGDGDQWAIHLAPLGAPMALTLRQHTFDVLAASLHVWALGKGVKFLPRPGQGTAPAYELLTALLQGGVAQALPHKYFFLQDDEQRDAFRQLQMKGLACFTDEASGRIASTSHATEGLCVAQLYSGPTPICEYMSKARARGQLDENTVFELLLILLQGGWQEVGKASKKRVDPYVVDGPKIAYYDTSSATISRLYLRCLIQADEIFAKGVRAIHHFQPQLYYRCLLECDAAQAARTGPNLNTTAYRRLLGLPTAGAAPSPAEDVGRRGGRGYFGRGRGQKRKKPETGDNRDDRIPEMIMDDGNESAGAADVHEGAAGVSAPCIGDVDESDSGRSPSTPASVRAEVARRIAAGDVSGLSSDHDDDDGAPAPSARAPEPPRAKQRRRQSAEVAAGPSSSLYDPSTIHIGPFAIVRRHIHGVPAMFVNCPIHTYKDSDGTVHRCSKSMQLNQPDEATVIKRLHQWVYAGTQMVPAPAETEEELRLRHVRTVPSRDPADLGDQAELAAHVVEYCRRSEWQGALQLLAEFSSHLLRTDAVSFSGAISACERRSYWRVALDLLSLEDGAPSFGAFSCTSSIAACAKSEMWHQAVAIFNRISASRMVPTVAVANSLLRAYERSAQWQPAVSLLSRGASQKDVISYGTSISTFERQGQWLQALEALKGMSLERLPADLITYNAAMSSCGGLSSRWQLTLSIFGSIEELGLRTDAVSYSAAGRGTLGQWRWALQLLGCMRVELLEVDIICHGTVMSICEKAAPWQRALLLFDTSSSLARSTDAVSYSSAISACARSSHMSEALAVLESMEDVLLSPDLVCYCGAMAACERAGDWEMALAVLSAMMAARVMPDTISYSSLISACEKAANWQLAVHFLVIMHSVNVAANVITFNAAISACEQRGRWPVALALLCALNDRMLKPDMVSHNSALSSCEKASHWQTALQLFTVLAPGSLRPN
ncbi:unnamed protein product, partial [Symbiodinium sp. CCMP2456]